MTKITEETIMYWHYAPWEYLPSIVESGNLRASNAGAPDELPMLWFSANQQWEPTATKVDNKQNRGNAHDIKQQDERFGCIRFGLSATDSRLLNWNDACHANGITRDIRRSMEKAGKKLGGDPANWYATAQNISITELYFQVWVGSWGNAVPEEMAATRLEVKESRTQKKISIPSQGSQQSVTSSMNRSSI
jgi:hypothetical protein